MKKISIALLIALSALLLTACGEEEEATTIEGTGYTFEAPAGWEETSTDDLSETLEESGAEVTGEDVGASYDVLLLGDVASDVQENFNVVIREDLPPDVDSEKYAEQNAELLTNPEQAAQFFPEGVELDTSGADPRPTKWGGEEAYEIEYSASAPAGDLAFRVIVAVHEGAGYVGTFTSAADEAEDAQGDYEEIIDSWEFE